MKTTFKLKVLTPMFMGGADPEGEPELRPASIRGAMRFWFRAIAGAVTNKPEDVYRLESEVFGNTERKSKVVVRVKVLSKKLIQKGSLVPFVFAANSKTIENILKGNNERWKRNLKIMLNKYGQPIFESKIEKAHQLNFLAYLANMGLAKYESSEGEFTWIRPAFDIDTIFKIEIHSNDEEILKITENTFILTVNLGGFGARWRHGFGSCLIVEDGQFYKKSNLEQVVSYLQSTIKKLVEDSTVSVSYKPNRHPDFPIFHPDYAEVWEGFLSNCSNSWTMCLSQIGMLYREFRVKDVNRFGHTQDFLDIIKPIFERKQIQSEDPINDIFGLPIQFSKIYKINDRKVRKTATIKVEKEQINRRASPLILHVEPENKLVRATSFISKFIPDDTKYFVDKAPNLPLEKPKGEDFDRIRDFLRNSLGLTRRYPHV